MTTNNQQDKDDQNDPTDGEIVYNSAQWDHQWSYIALTDTPLHSDLRICDQESTTYQSSPPCTEFQEILDFALQEVMKPIYPNSVLFGDNSAGLQYNSQSRNYPQSFIDY